MPIYNVEKYLYEAIESVLNQTFSDFELIIVNDGSKDNSILIAEDFIKKDTRVKIIHQENSGLSVARNTGIKSANGKFVYFMDSDDYIESNTLEKVVSYFNTNEIDVLFFKAKTFLDNSNNEHSIIEDYNKYYERPYLKEGVYNAVDYYEKMTLHNNFVASACLQISKLDLLKENKLFFEKGIINEDELFTRELLFIANTIFFCDEKFYSRRIRDFSITTSEVKTIKPSSMLLIAERLFDLGVKKDNNHLKNDSQRFFSEAISIIEDKFKNDSILISKLFKSKLFFKFKNQNKRILILKFPFLVKLYKTIFK